MSNKVQVNLPTVNGGMEYCILSGKTFLYSYRDGKRINDEATGTRIDVVLQGNRFTPLSVKIEGDRNVLPELTDEQISTACSTLKLIPVKFNDCSITLYSINNNMVMSATASGCEIVKNYK